MRGKLVALWLMVATGNASAQSDAGLRRNTVRGGILALLDPYNPGVEISIERQLDSKSSVHLNAAYLRDFFNRTPYRDFSGARFSVAKKWAFKSRKHYRWYYGLETGVSTTSYDTRGRFTIPNEEGKVSLFYREYHESFTVQKQTVFAGGRVGVQGAIRCIAYDISVGLGAKYKRTQHLGRRYAGGVLFPGFIRLDPYQIADREKSGLVGNLPMAVSVGYTF